MSVPFHDRPEIMFNPDIIDRRPGFSLQLDQSWDPLTDDGPWKLGLECYVGHYLVFDMPNHPRRVWKIVGTNRRQQALIVQWPD
jgi:hypothetical protein